MNCPKCNKVVPITKVLQPKGDAIVCAYCQEIIPVESIVWSDGKFHFVILGDVTAIKLANGPRVLMQDQSASVLDIQKIRSTATRIIYREPNLRCICSEFMIKDSNIRVELLLENKE